MKRLFAFSLLLPLLISGCASTPQTPEEFRQSAEGSSMFGLHEAYEVDRPYPEVAKALEAQTGECLNAELVRNICAGNPNGCIERKVVITPTVVRESEKTEIHVQAEQQSGVIYAGGEPPEGGPYIAVADVTPAGSGKTAMEVYSSTAFFGKETIPSAIKHWAKGTNLGCPNLAGS